MQTFTERTIVPKGRFKYGEYLAAGNVTNKVTKTIYGGNGSTNDLGGNGGGDTGGTENLSWQLFLSKGSYAFDGAVISATGSQSAETSVIGVLGSEQTLTYVGDVTGTHTYDPNTDTYSPELPANYGITGMPTTGMVVVVNNNGDPAGTTITITVDNTLPASANTGTLYIPCAVILKQNRYPGDSIIGWEEAYKDGAVTMLILEFSWSVSSNAQSSYRLDLSNDAGSINCDEDGNVLTGATRPSCQATLYLGNDPYTGTSYSLIYNNSQNVTGLGYHTSNGVCYIDYDSPTYFNFEGDHLDIGIQASVGGQPMGTKVFTITKSLPSEGHPATSYWLTFSANGFKYNPNATPPTMTPSAITAELMMQVGQNTPTAATGCSIWYGYDTDSPATLYTTGITPTVSAEYVSVKAVKGNLVSDPIVDGVEFLPILRDGKNGSGGTSVYRIDLTNENASINCDSDGNILAGAVRPTCTAQLYYGSSACTGVTYSISTASCSYSGVSIDSSTGTITFNPGTASTPFWFDTNYTSIEFTISAQIGAVEYGPAIMTVSRNIAGSDGTPARSYWLALSADAIKVDSGNTATPSSITATAYAQIGDGTPYIISNVIKWGYNGSTSNTYTSAITVDKTKDYMTFRLMLDNIQRDIETVPILRDGQPGQSTPGRRGPAIRGPIDWYDGANQSGRRWCNGEGPLETDKDWIDIIVKDGTTYRCITSYNEQGQAWSAVSSNWTAATEYDFVATQLLLASAASINFLTNNELYLKDSNGNITGGAAGGDGVNFWAGSDTPGDAPFQVSADGSIKAMSGTFAGYIQMPYYFISNLTPDEKLTASTVGTKYISQTIWKGKLTSAPENPASGWCYYNTSTSPGRFYYYTTTWRQMTNVNEPRGYVSDEHAYLIADGFSGNYGMGDGGMLVIPEPSAALNGFTYHIVVVPNIATRSQGQNPAISVMTANASESFIVYCYTTMLETSKRLSFYGGHVEMTCVPVNDGTLTPSSYIWAVTQCTGGVDCYSGTTTSSFTSSYSTVCGYSTEDPYQCITKIKADSSLPSNKKVDTLYITRN